MKYHLLNKGARMLLLFLLLCSAGMWNVARAQLTEWEQQQPYLFYLVYADEQAHESEMPCLPATADMRYEQLPHDEGIFLENHEFWYGGGFNHPVGILGLAKNERMGFQVFYREQEKERSIRVELSDFLNATGDTLPHTVYYEEFFFAKPYPDFIIYDSLAEALVPYRGEFKETNVGHNKVFYVELNSSKTQPSGTYTSTVSIYEDSTLLQSKQVYAKVWNFALPESHYSEVVMGLHNNASIYGSTQSMLIYNGVHATTSGIPDTEEDRILAKQILIGYQEFLLDHGISTFEIPRWLIDDDPKAAELTMADPRRKVFTVPVNYGHMNGSVFNQTATNLIAQYKGLVYENPFLKDKAFFYSLDEPKNANDFAVIDQFCSVLSNYWPEYHAVAPFNYDYEQALDFFGDKIDILCPNQETFNPRLNGLFNEMDSRINDFKQKSHTWRYFPAVDACTGGLDFYMFPLLSVGTMRRVLFWQQYAMNSGGILYWNCASHGYNPWTNKTLPEPSDVWWTGQHGNGDGILLYPGLPIGEEATIPIASLRLKQIAMGINDYDYLRLTEEFLGQEASQSRLREIFRVIDTHISSIMTNQYLYDVVGYENGIEGFIGYSSYYMNRVKYRMGETLSAANTEHDWSEWQIAVLPDESHDGLEIRTCSHCGIQESRSMSYTSLYRFVGTEDNQWANLNNWANSPETLPSTSESVVIDSDCEINDNTEVYYVVVNDGFNLTINEGATFTSQRITTEGDAQVIIEDGAQLFTMSEGVQATVKKNVTTQGDTNRWYFISTSLASDVVPSESNGLLSSTEDNYDLYWFNQGDNLEWRNYKSDSFSLENGIGYLYANSEEDASLVFTGTTNGSISKEFVLDYDANVYLAGWNLVGNPYPCEVYANTSYYTLNDDGSAIEPNPVSSTVAIPACTGIMVKAEAEGESVVFSKSAPETAANKGVLQIALNMSMTESVEISTGTKALIDKVIVSFNQGDELNKLVFSKDNAKLYIPKGNEDYAIACVDKQGELPLNFEAKENGNYTISVTPESVKMNYLHLIDNITGEDIDLLVTPNYSFEANGIDNPSRFRLVFSAD